MSRDGPTGARARFLAAVEGTAHGSDGANRLCTACVLALPVQRAGMMISVPDVGLEVLSASDRVAERTEWLQVTLSQGPAVDASARSVPISVPDLNEANGRWPIFLSEVADSGIGGMYALPLQIGAIKVGVLDLYCTAEAPLGAAEFAEAVAISELVTAVLLNVDRDGHLPDSLGPWWNQPPSTREVHQATGMVMAQLGLDARSAYVRLQAFAFEGGRLLQEVAADVVSRRERLRRDPADNSGPEQ